MSTYIHAEKINELREVFLNSAPYGHTDIGDLFNSYYTRGVAREVEHDIKIIPSEKNIYASYRKHKLSSIEDMPDKTRSFIAYLNSEKFIKVLTTITGIEELYSDFELRGGGIHAIGRGGFLKLHTDFNWHSGLSMHRRLNLLVYLNEDWQTSWNGQVELWNSDATIKIFSLLPKIGNALLFETSDISYHGHPDPVQCPEGVFRKSIAMYYYSPSRPPSEVLLGKSEMTNYVERPSETFNNDKLRRIRHKIQLKIKKIAHSVNK